MAGKSVECSREWKQVKRQRPEREEETIIRVSVIPVPTVRRMRGIFLGQADMGAGWFGSVRNIGRVRWLEALVRGWIVQSMNGSHADHVAGGGVPLMSDDRDPVMQ